MVARKHTHLLQEKKAIPAKMPKLLEYQKAVDAAACLTSPAMFSGDRQGPADVKCGERYQQQKGDTTLT